MALYRLGEDVGGVGGVGGLTNLWNPFANCTTTAGGVNAPYCFHPGWLGFTPLGGGTLLYVTLPLFVAAIFASFRTVYDVKDVVLRSPLYVTSFSVFWAVAACLWFAVPLATFASSPFYQTDIAHAVLAISISAAFPLSWHLSFVAIPTTGKEFLAPIFGLSKDALKKCHVRIGWATMFWGIVHGIGQIFYLVSTGTLGSSLAFKAFSDNLLFWFGLVNISILIVHGAFVFFRHHPRVAPKFRRTHRWLAALLLLGASAHWWPFALFLAPAIATAATGYALDARLDTRVKVQHATLALAFALVAAVCGIGLVWVLRQEWMMAHPHDLYSPFVFPPLAVSVAFASGVAVAAGTSWLVARSTERSAHHPMLAPLQSDSA
jgi:hypothetical protein